MSEQQPVIQPGHETEIEISRQPDLLEVVFPGETWEENDPVVAFELKCIGYGLPSRTSKHRSPPPLPKLTEVQPRRHLGEIGDEPAPT